MPFKILIFLSPTHLSAKLRLNTTRKLSSIVRSQIYGGSQFELSQKQGPRFDCHLKARRKQVKSCINFNATRLVSRKAKQDRIRLEKKIMSFSDFDLDSYDPIITHGESVVDRKSVFQGHCAVVQRVEHVDLLLSKLKENRKIENAFHNMWAYRLDRGDPEARSSSKSASIMQDCDDDGEQAAGGRLLSLLQILNVVNVMVVVTRWYGGIQLGPARFKHINNAARDALVKGGFVSDGPGESGAASSQDKTKPGGKGKSAGKKRSK